MTTFDENELPAMPICFDADVLEDYLSEHEGEKVSISAVVLAISIADMSISETDIADLHLILDSKNIEIDAEEGSASDKPVVSRNRSKADDERLSTSDEIRIGTIIIESSLDLLRECFRMPFSAQMILDIAESALSGARNTSTIFDVARFRGNAEVEEECVNEEDEEIEAPSEDPDSMSDVRSAVADILAFRDKFRTLPISEDDVEEIVQKLHTGLRFRLSVHDTIVSNLSTKNSLLLSVKNSLYRIAEKLDEDKAEFANRVMSGDINGIPDKFHAGVRKAMKDLNAFEASVGLDHTTFSSHFRLIMRSDRANQKARAEMTNKNHRLVIATAQNYTSHGMSPEDLAQEGKIGLMRAVEKFDPTKGNKFATYATWWIRQAITRAISDQSSIIRIPVHMRERIIRIKKAERILTEMHGIPPGLAELSEHLSMPVDQIRRALTIANNPVSLDAPVSNDGNSDSIGDMIPDYRSQSPIVGMLDQARTDRVQAALEKMHPRTEEILHYRYGLGKIPAEENTLESVGKRFGLTRERIRQIEAKSIQALGNNRKNGLKDLVSHEDIIADASSSNAALAT